jgi:hypothetical protein
MPNNPYGQFGEEEKPLIGPKLPPMLGPEPAPPVYGPELPPGGLQTSPVDPELARKKLLDDILGQEYSDEAGKEIREGTKRPNIGEGIAMALSGLGDAMARGYGRVNTDFLKQTVAQSKARRAGEREDFEKGKKGTIEKYFLNQKLETELGRKDPGSKMSQLAQKLMAKFDKTRDWSDMSAEQLEPYLGKYQAVYEGELKAEANRIAKENSNFWKSQAAADRKAKFEDKQHARDQKKVDFAINALSGLKRAGASGQFQMSNKRVLLIEDGLRVIERLIEGDLKKDKTIEAELAAQIASAMMGGNQPSERTIEHFMSNTAQSNMAGIYKYVTGQPADAMTDAIVNHYKHQLEGQAKYWKDRRNQVTNGQYVKLESVFKNPIWGAEERDRFERWASTMFGKGGMVDPSQFHAGGGQPGGRGAGGGYLHVPAKRVQRWIKDENGDTVALMKTPEGWLEVKPTEMEGFVPDIYQPPGKVKPTPSPTPVPGRGGYGMRR